MGALTRRGESMFDSPLNGGRAPRRERWTNYRCLRRWLAFNLLFVPILLASCGLAKNGLESRLQANASDYTTLYRLAKVGNVPPMRELLHSHRVDVDHRYRDNETLLMRASSDGYEDVVALLLANGASVNLCDGFGVTALGYSAGSHSISIARRLANAGSNVEGVKRGPPPLVLAAQASKYDLVRFLVDQGAKIDARDSQGRSALWWSEKVGDRRSADFLRVNGARR